MKRGFVLACLVSTSACKMLNPQFGLSAEETGASESGSADASASDSQADGDATADASSTGDGDTDVSTGDGDATGMGDGDATSMGDGDATSMGDGDATSMGDGDATSMGDGDSNTSGDGDGDGCLSDEACDFPYGLCSDRGVCVASSQIVWLNFNGGGYSYDTSTPSNSHTNKHDVSPFVNGDYGGFGGEASLVEAIFSLVNNDYAPFRIAVTLEEPEASADYAEVAIINYGDQAPTLTLTKINCDAVNPNPIAFVMMTPGEGYTAAEFANAISSIAALSLGLERTTLEGDLMLSYLQAEDVSFLDQCGNTPDSFLCAHEWAACNSEEQNSYRELESLFGLR